MRLTKTTSFFVLLITLLLFAGCAAQGGGDSSSSGDQSSKSYFSDENSVSLQAPISIIESDASTVVEEGGMIDSYGISLSQKPESDMYVTIQTDGETCIGYRAPFNADIFPAEAGNDNGALLEPMSFPAQVGYTVRLKLLFTPDDWNKTRTILVRAVDDDVEEGDHYSRIVHVVSDGRRQLEALRVVTLAAKIIDNDEVPLEAAVSFVTNSKRASENDPYVLCEARLELVSHVELPRDISIPIGVVPSSTATVGSDVSLSGLEFKFPMGATNGSISSVRIIIQDDNEMENVEALDLKIRATVSGAVTAQWSNFKLVLHDNDHGSLLGVQGTSRSIVTLDSQTGEVYKRSAWGLNAKHIGSATMDYGTGAIFVIDSGNHELMRYNPFSGTVNSVGYLGYQGDSGLAYDPVHHLLYGASTQNLYEVDPATGHSVLIGPMTYKDIDALEYNSITGMLLAVNDSGPNNKLIEMNPASGVGTVVFDLPEIGGIVDGLAFDESSNTLYVADGQYRKIYRVDLGTGEVGFVCDTSEHVGWIRALLYDPVEKCLISFNDGRTLRVNPESGEISRIHVYQSANLKGLGYSPRDKMFYAPSNEGFLVAINPDTGIMETVGYMNLPPITFLGDMVYRPATEKFYAYDTYGVIRVLYEIDPKTASAVIVGTLPVSASAGCLAYNPAEDLLYTLVNGDELYSIDPDTLTSVYMCEIDSAAPSIAGLAYDPVESMLYGLGGYSSGLFSIDINTGEIGQIKTMLFSASGRIGFNDDDGLLYVVSPVDNQLVKFHTDTLRFETVGGVGFGGTSRLAFDPETGVVYGGQYKYLTSVDPLYGEISIIGLLGNYEARGMSWHGPSATLFGFINTYYDEFVSVDTQTGEATTITQFSSIQDVRGLVFNDANGKMYLINTSSRLYAFSMDDFILEYLGNFPPGNYFSGFAYDPVVNTLYSIRKGSVLCTIAPDDAEYTDIGSEYNPALDITGLTWFE